MFTVEKQGHSRWPWRLLRDGKQVWTKARFDHPDMGWTVVDEPVAADTKAEVIAKAFELMEIMAAKLERLQPGD